VDRNKGRAFRILPRGTVFAGEPFWREGREPEVALLEDLGGMDAIQARTFFLDAPLKNGRKQNEGLRRGGVAWTRRRLFGKTVPRSWMVWPTRLFPGSFGLHLAARGCAPRLSRAAVSTC